MTDKQTKEGIDVSQYECYLVEDDSCNDTLSGSFIKEKCQTFRLLQTIKSKEQECEGLKKELQAQRAFTAHEQKLIYCVAYDESCKTGNDCKQEKCIFKDNIKLKQTLTEIKEIAENINTECFYNDFDCKDCDMKNGCSYQEKIKILQKISECEGNNEN